MLKFIKSIILLGLIVFTQVSLRPVREGITYLSVPSVIMTYNWVEWLSLEAKIQNAETDTVILLWEGQGGRVDLGQRFIEFIQRSDKRVILRVIGGSYSMHANIVCVAREIQFNAGFLMFHLPADSASGRVILDRWAQDEVQEYMDPCQAKGIVTQEDIERVQQDMVLYVYPDGRKEFTGDIRRSIQ